MSNDLKVFQVLEQESTSVITQANEVKITNQLTYEKSCDFLKIVKGLQKKIEESFNPIVQKAHSAWKESISQRDKHLNPVKSAEQLVKEKINSYLAYREMERRREELKLRQEAEARAQKERERLAERADKWEEKGKTEKAEDLKEQAEQVEALTPVVMPNVQKVNGISTRKVWKAKVINFDKLPSAYKLPNQQLLDSVARTTKGNQQIEGVEFYSENIVTSR